MHYRRQQPAWKRNIFLVLAWVLFACLFWGLSSRFGWIFTPKVPVPRGPVPVVNIAVIGAGPAGISTAFTLARGFENRNDVKVNITVFEQTKQIGGRMAPSSFAHRELGMQIHAEDVAGGCLAHNGVLRERARKYLGVSFGMNGDMVVEGRKDTVGFWDGSQSMVAEMVRPRYEMSWGQWIKLVWRYGPAFWKAEDLPKGTMLEWRSLLRLKEMERSAVFDKVEEWVSEGAMTNAVALSATQRLKKNGVEGDYVRDILRAQVRRQTGAELEELSDLALSMALEREDAGLCAEGQGGRLADIMERFLHQSKAELKLDTKINALKRESFEDGTEAWILELIGPGQQEWKNPEMTYEVFDKVIIAAPWNTSSLLTSKEAENHEQIPYRPLLIEFVASKSKLDPKYFGNPATLPSQLLNLQSLPFLHGCQIEEITHLRDIYHPSPSNTTHLYRVLFSGLPVVGTSVMLWGGLEEIEGIHTTNIKAAYPALNPRSDGFGEFKLGEGLWWTGGMEATASQVDLAWVAGENVGKLAGRDIERN